MAGEIASTIAVEYLASNPDADLLRSLIEIVEAKSMDPQHRNETYKVLHRLATDGEGPSADEYDFMERIKYGRIDMLEIIDPTVLQKAKMWLSR
jgi:hypothetical protein